MVSLWDKEIPKIKIPNNKFTNIYTIDSKVTMLKNVCGELLLSVMLPHSVWCRSDADSEQGRTLHVLNFIWIWLDVLRKLCSNGSSEVYWNGLKVTFWPLSGVGVNLKINLYIFMDYIHPVKLFYTTQLFSDFVHFLINLTNKFRKMETVLLKW